jgi:hypothetical protein
VHLHVLAACALYDAPENGCILHPKHVERGKCNKVTLNNLHQAGLNKPIIFLEHQRPNHSLKFLKYLLEKQHTNVTVINILQSIDLNATRDVNEETTNFNRKLSKLATKLMYTGIVCADLSRNYFAQRRLHVKNSGKEEIIKQSGQLRGIPQELFQ